MPSGCRAGWAAVAPRSAPRDGRALRDGVVDQQDDDGSDDRADDACGAEALVLAFGAEQQVGEEATDERADDAEQDGLGDAHGVVAGDERPGHEAGDEPDDDQTDDETDHCSSSCVGPPAGVKAVYPSEAVATRRGDVATVRVSRGSAEDGRDRARVEVLEQVRCVVVDLGCARLPELVGGDAAAADTDAGDATGVRSLGVPHRVADHDGSGRRRLRPLEREAEDVGCRLALLDLRGVHRGVDPLVGADHLPQRLDVLLAT
ncbi:MAG: hypothetical protein AVDCRST_MAG20-1305 [uncultured Acidimicrobiales bacterium]|uniref:Uncharacterized protein n=1 Tax=uncultured Acidimicrobiales bacterium TaxID=310071 RepID=A0A6J4HVY5_9ACTN|nr:MAG: hypothetical protein AVDCRST_MAG20-1305 [uncultured Acidimicrobiales bacterium]